MDIIVFRPNELLVALGALRKIEALPRPKQDRYLEFIARLHGASIHATALPEPSARDTAAAITEPHARKRLVQLGIVMSMVDGAITPDSIARLSELARALDVEERGIGTLSKITAGRRLGVRVDVMGRTAGKIVVDAYRDSGLIGAFRIVLAFLQWFEDRAMRRRFAELEGAPPGSLGRALWAHCTDRGFRLPGERGGIPERGLFHDVGHILAGYDTDSAGEIQQSAFQAGYMRKGGFGHLLLGIIHFHLGIKITPVAEGATGHFDVEKVMVALARGAACKIDLSDAEQFDFWALAHLPVTQLRVDFGVPPLPAALESAA